MENKPYYVWLKAKMHDLFFVILIDEQLKQKVVYETPKKSLAKKLVEQLNKELEK